MKFKDCDIEIDVKLTYCVSCAGGEKDEKEMKIEMPDIYKAKLQKILGSRACYEDHHKATSDVLDALNNSINAFNYLYKIDNRFQFHKAFNDILEKLEEVLK